MHLEVDKIPTKHILKRWTTDARDILPSNLVHYQKDRGAHKSVTTRHTRLYLKALELVRLGDSNIETYDVAMDILTGGVSTLTPLSKVKDGMGVAEKQIAAGSGSSAACIETVAESGETMDWLHNLKGLSAPSKKRGPGRPSSSRVKAPCENSTKRTRFCSICREWPQKHNLSPARRQA